MFHCGWLLVHALHMLHIPVLSTGLEVCVKTRSGRFSLVADRRRNFGMGACPLADGRWFRPYGSKC